jgi:hypothetical protein
MALAAHKTDDSEIVLSKSDVPAVFAGRPDNVSARYVHIHTADFMQPANDAGWVLFNAGTKKRNRRTKANNPNAIETAGHFLAFRPSDDWINARGLANNLNFNGGIGRVSRAIPRLILYNSHDKTMALKAVLGLFEFICSNAAIMCSDSWGKWSFRHMNINPMKMLDFFRQIIEVAPYIIDTRDAMSKIEVTQNQALDLAEQVIDLRWKDGAYQVDPATLVAPRFEEQSDLTAYNVFQTVQHHLIQGGDHFTNKETKKVRKQRVIKDFKNDFNINRGLWQIANKWLNDMGHQLPPPPKLDIDVR